MKKKKKIPPLPEIPAGIFAIDTHCHLDMSAYEDDCDLIISRAFAAGVKKIITVGIDLPSSQKAMALAEKNQGIFAAIGMHPHHAGEVSADDYAVLTKLAKHPKVVAYGEIGMDLARDYCPVEVQRSQYHYQVKLAKKLNLPVIIHDRDAHDEVLAILQKEAPFPAGGLIHCFSGDRTLAQEILALGFYISIPGVVTFKGAKELQEVAQCLPIESLVLETDGPFLTPVPRRGKRNEPAYVLYTAQEIARLRDIPLDDLICQTTKNAEKLFGI